MAKKSPIDHVATENQSCGCYKKLSKKDIAIYTTKAPFPASKSRVKRAAFLLPVRSTFVAPVFPEPIERKSPKFKALLIIDPKLIDPSK